MRCLQYLLSHIIEHSAQRDGDSEAFRFMDQSLTYGMLDERSNQLAHLLRDRGVRRGDRVGICLNKCIEAPVAMYGIMKAGAAYVPLDPAAPAKRLSYVLQHCGIRHVVTQGRPLMGLSEALGGATPVEHVIGSEDYAGLSAADWVALAAWSSDSPPDTGLMEQDLAYIMYTSGSTGDPKGIVHTHYSGLSYARLSAQTYGVTHEDRLSNHSPLHFDMSTFDYFSGPLCGAATVIIPEGYAKLPASLSQLIQDQRLTIWYSVPFALIQLLLRGVLEKRQLESLRWVLFGASPFRRSICGP